MGKVLSLTLKCLCLIILMCTTAQAVDNNLIPDVRIVFISPPIKDCAALSLLGEVGNRNFRCNGTYGQYLTSYQRFKFSGEFLAEQLEYKSLTEQKGKMVYQYALGGAYQFLLPNLQGVYLLPIGCFESLDLGGSYSHAFSKRLSILQRIAGSNGGFGYIGSGLRLWTNGLFSARADYDYVQYNREFESKLRVNGWGGSFNFAQPICGSLVLNLFSEFRKPFYFYEFGLDWDCPLNCGIMNWGIYGNYTEGKKGLPNVATAGVRLSLAFGTKTVRKNPSDFSTCAPCDAPTAIPCCYHDFCNPCERDLSGWVASPAVYVPIVLAVTDIRLPSPPPPPCSPPTSDPLPPQFLLQGSPTMIPLAGFFHSTLPLTFTATGLPPNLVINASTGTITGTPIVSGTFTAIITATSSCNSTSQPLAILVSQPP